MDFDHLMDSLNPDPLVQQKKKYETFTIKTIGGPNEIVKWREMQAAKESVYRLKLADREKRISQYESEIGQKLASPTIHTTSWEEKLAFAKSEQKRLAKLEEVAARPRYEFIEPPKPSLLQRFTRFAVSLWKSANF